MLSKHTQQVVGGDQGRHCSFHPNIRINFRILASKARKAKPRPR